MFPSGSTTTSCEVTPGAVMRTRFGNSYCGAPGKSRSRRIVNGFGADHWIHGGVCWSTKCETQAVPGSPSNAEDARLIGDPRTADEELPPARHVRELVEQRAGCGGTHACPAREGEPAGGRKRNDAPDVGLSVGRVDDGPRLKVCGRRLLAVGEIGRRPSQQDRELVVSEVSPGGPGGQVSGQPQRARDTQPGDLELRDPSRGAEPERPGDPDPELTESDGADRKRVPPGCQRVLLLRSAVDADRNLRRDPGRLHQRMMRITPRSAGGSA